MFLNCFIIFDDLTKSQKKQAAHRLKSRLTKMFIESFRIEKSLKLKIHKSLLIDFYFFDFRRFWFF